MGHALRGVAGTADGRGSDRAGYDLPMSEVAASYTREIVGAL